MLLPRDSIQGFSIGYCSCSSETQNLISNTPGATSITSRGVKEGNLDISWSAMTLCRPLDTELFSQLTYSNFCPKCNVSEEGFNAAY